MPADKYAPRSPDDVKRLVLENPLAWIVSGAADAPRSTLLPIRPRLGEDGRITHLLGHFARHNRQVTELRANPRASILFLGPQAYISPSCLADRTQAPTWNYTGAEFRVDVEFSEDPADLEAILRDLVDAMESGRPNAWTVDDMGERYRKLAPRIVPFEGVVRDVHAAFKLGQDESEDVYADIRRGLESIGRADLLEWMDRFNPGRAPSND